MITLFKRQPNATRRNVVFPRFQYIAQRLSDNVNKAVNYFEFRRGVVPANHPLVRFIDSIVVPHSMGEREYFNTATDASYFTGRAIGFGSSIYAPIEFRSGVFYGSLVSEYIYLVPSEYEPQVDSYRDWRPVNVRVHPRSDFSLFPLMPKFANNESGYAVITIDPGLLMLQYREWRKEQLRLPEGERLTTPHFVYMYVLPNMLYSHIDVAWLNKIINSTMGLAVSPTRPLSGLALPSADTFVTEVIDKIVDTITAREYHFESVLLGIPTPFSGTMFDTALLPKLPFIRSTKGFELLSTLPWIEFIFALDATNESQQNRLSRNELSVALRRATNERWLDFVDKSDMEDIEERLAFLKVRYLD